MTASSSRWWLLALLLLAATLRLLQLSYESIWLDEALTWVQVNGSYAAMMESVRQDVHPPVYFHVLQFFVWLGGDSEFMLRFPSALFGVLTVWVTYLCGKRLDFGRAALVPALLVAVSMFHIRYSQEARMYTLMAFLTGWSMLTLLNLRRREAGLGAMLHYLLATILLMYTHIYGMFAVMAQSLYVIPLAVLTKQPPIPLKRWLLLQVIVAVSFLPWVGTLLSQVDRVSRGFWIGEPGIADFFATFSLYSGGITAAVLTALLASLAVRKLTDKKHGESLPETFGNEWFLLCWLLTPILVPFVISQFTQPIFYGRYTIAASLAWYLLVGAGLSVAWQQPRWRPVLLLLTAVVVVWPAGKGLRYFTEDMKPDWRGVVAYVEERAEPGDLVIFHNLNIIEPYRYYAARDDLKLHKLIPGRDAFVPDFAAAEAVNFDELTAPHNQVWIVLAYTRGWEFDVEDFPELMAGFELQPIEPLTRRVIVQRYIRQ